MAISPEFLQSTYAPLLMGFLAGITVFLGTIPFSLLSKKTGPRGIGVLQALTGGILAYLALEVGSEVAEYVERLATPDTLGDFLVASLSTTIALLATWFVLSSSEKWEGIGVIVRHSLHKNLNTGLLNNKAMYKALDLAGRTSFIVALGLGIHNIGEGFAIAAAMLGGAVASAILFTIGFAIHNFTEGFAIVGPLAGEAKTLSRIPLRFLGLTSAIAALPTVLGASVYYFVPANDLLLVVLNTIAEASLVYALIRVNLSAMGKLGGPSSRLFWTSLGLGVILTYGLEAIVLLALSA